MATRRTRTPPIAIARLASVAALDATAQVPADNDDTFIGDTDDTSVNSGIEDQVDVDDDNDGILDGDEATPGTDPLNPDSDNDGALDGDEVTAGTDPLNPDTDNDGMLEPGEGAAGSEG